MCVLVCAYTCSVVTPSRVHLVCPFLSVCLSHFHAPDWFKLNCPSCSYHFHPQRQTHTDIVSDHRHAQLHTQQHIHRRTYRTYTHSAALCSPCQRRLWQHFYLLNVWKCNYVSVWMCVCVHVCVRLHARVILTTRWVSEGHWKHRQQCQKSGSYSSHWGERVGEILL